MTSTFTSGGRTTFLACLSIFLLGLFTAGNVTAQTVYIPDENFKNYLLASPVNSNGDDEIQESEAEAYSGLINASSRDISDLTGIEAFVNLSDLRVHNNNLTSLDLSQNTQLTQLHCQNNLLAELDLSNNPNLRLIRCQDNDLNSLNVGASTTLAQLECNGNLLTSLNLTSNSSLRILKCQDNQLETLNVGSNPVLFQLDCSRNSLSSLDLSNNNNLTHLNCAANQLTSLDVTGKYNLTQLRFQDNTVSEIDLSTNTILQILEVQNNQLTSLDLSINDELYSVNCSFNELTAVNLGSNSTLQYFFCFDNQLTELDVSGSSSLAYLSCYNNFLSALDVSANAALTTFYCHNNELTSLNMKNGNNGSIHEFQATGNSSLECIEVDDPLYSEANWSDDVDSGVAFSTDCSEDTGPVVHIPDTNFKAALLADEAINTNGDDEIQVSEATPAITVDVSGSSIMDMTGIEAFTSLETLDCSNNEIDILNLEFNHELTTLYCQNNELTFLELRRRSYQSPPEDFIAFDATGNPELSCIEVYTVGYFQEHFSENIDPGAEFNFDCDGDDQDDIVYIPDPVFKNYLLSGFYNYNGDDEIQYSEIQEQDIVQLNVSNLGISDLTGIEAFTDLELLDCSSNNLTSLDVGTLQAGDLFIDCSHNQISQLDYAETIYGIDVSHNNLTSFTLDAYFLAFFINNNNLSSLKITNTSEGLFSGDGFDAKNNPNLECVEVADPEYFENNFGDSVDDGVVYSTDCSDEGAIVHIPDENFKAALLANEAINTNGDDEIQTGEAANFTGEIFAIGKAIADLTGVEAFVNLQRLKVHYNNLTTVDLSANTQLTQLHIQHNQLTALDLSHNPKLVLLRAQNNSLTELDVSSNHLLRHLEAFNNNLTVLNVKNGNNTTMYKFEAAGNPDLECIEVDDPTFAESEWSDNTDEGVSFSTDCGTGDEPVVHIPDANFKSALVAIEDVNTNGDSEIQVSEAEAVTGLIQVTGENISDLTGIEAFILVTELKANYNNLASVDLSENVNLQKVHLQNNQLTSLDLVANTGLVLVRAQNNSLSALDVSANTALRHLEVNNNNLTSLNIKNGNNQWIYLFEAQGNPGLSCVEVDDVAHAEANWSDNVDGGASFSEDCSGSGARLAEQNMEMTETLTVSIYPNPAGDFMRVQSDQELDDLVLYTVNGEELNVPFTNGEADIRHLSSGVYILKISRGDAISSIRLVKQ